MLELSTPARCLRFRLRLGYLIPAVHASGRFIVGYLRHKASVRRTLPLCLIRARPASNFKPASPNEPPAPRPRQPSWLFWISVYAEGRSPAAHFFPEPPVYSLTQDSRLFPVELSRRSTEHRGA